MGSVNDGTGEDDWQKRNELEVVLVSRYKDVCATRGRCEKAQSIEEGLADLRDGRDLREIAEALEACGVLRRSEVLYFVGTHSKRQVIEEAKGLLQPRFALPTRRIYQPGCYSAPPYGVCLK